MVQFCWVVDLSMSTMIPAGFDRSQKISPDLIGLRWWGGSGVLLLKAQEVNSLNSSEGEEMEADSTFALRQHRERRFGYVTGLECCNGMADLTAPQPLTPELGGCVQWLDGPLVSQLADTACPDRI